MGLVGSISAGGSSGVVCSLSCLPLLLLFLRSGWVTNRSQKLVNHGDNSSANPTHLISGIHSARLGDGSALRKSAVQAQSPIKWFAVRSFLCTPPPGSVMSHDRGPLMRCMNIFLRGIPVLPRNGGG